MGRYAKGVDGVDHYYQPDDLFKYAGEPFDVRISILDESPDDALWVQVPEDNISRSLEDVLDELVIGAEPDQTEFIRDNLLELDEFPYLSDALDWVADIWHRFRNGDADLSLCINNGPDDVALQDTPREHMCTCVWRDGSLDYMLLDLVFEPGDMTLLGMLGDRKQEFLQWMKGFVALYKLDMDSGAEKQLRKAEKLEEAREQLFFHNLVAKGARGRLSITQQGRRAIGRLIEEQEELIARFDVYRDVVIRRKKKGDLAAEFGTLSGADYRVSAYDAEDVDPFRAVFLLTLLSGDLEEDLKAKDWVERINDERFYENILAPVVDHSALKPEETEQLVEQGHQYLAKTSALRQRANYSEGVLQRAKSKTIQAFPRKGLPGTEENADEGEPKKAFLPASKTAPSDELGEPPLPEDEPVKALPSRKGAKRKKKSEEPAAKELESTERASAPPPPQETKGRSQRRFRGGSSPRRTVGFGGGPTGSAGGSPAGAGPKSPTKKPPKNDEDDGWL